MRVYDLARIASVGLLFATAHAHAAGTLVVAGDEWVLTDHAYADPYKAGTSAFVANLAATFGGESYLILTGNSTTYGALNQVAAQFEALGKSVTLADGLAADLGGYDAVFHIGQQLTSTANLSSYVASGGNLYVSLGSGWYGNAVGEANFWNPFLNSYGLHAGNTWFSSTNLVPSTVTSGPPEVTSLLWGYGQSIEPLSNSDGISYVRGSFTFGPTDIGLIGTSKMLVNASAVPEPATWATMILGVALVGANMRRYNQRATKVSFAG